MTSVCQAIVPKCRTLVPQSKTRKTKKRDAKQEEARELLKNGDDVMQKNNSI